MPEFDAAPPNTHAGSKDDALRTKSSDPMTAPTKIDISVGYTDERVNMEEYERTVPIWKRVWQHSLTQMMLLSVQAFCGPAMADAIAGIFIHACRIVSLADNSAGLGGGGLATPQTSNIATAVNYTMLAVCCALGGPVVNKLGTKWSLVVGAASFPIRGSSYYCNSKFGNQWYLILGGFFTGIGTGTWYVAESGTIMSLAPANSRGKYLALWIVARNLGQLVGGAIK
jgi:MFS family permease